MILGCTHYPLLRSKIRAYMGEKIQIVNPAYETAMDLKKLLKERDWQMTAAKNAHIMSFMSATRRKNSEDLRIR